MPALSVEAMTSETTDAARAPGAGVAERFRRRAGAKARQWAHTVWRLVVTTVGSCMRYRVTGLAAEGAFFAVVSVPPLIFALAGAVGYVSEQFSAAQVEQVRQAVIELCSTFLTASAVDDVITPTMNEVLDGGRLDVISLGFVLALWSGSRALNVFVDTITIMHGLGGHRGIVKTRALAFFLYILAMITGAIPHRCRARRQLRRSRCRWWWQGRGW